jgi:hypothetical protein
MTKSAGKVLPQSMPSLADDLNSYYLNSHYRYNAASLAACGHGADAAKLDDKERARLCSQALTWLS